MSHKKGKKFSGWGESVNPRKFKAAARLGDLEAVDDLRSDQQIAADQQLESAVGSMQKDELIEEFTFILITPGWGIWDMSVPIGLITADQYKKALVNRAKQLGFSMEVEGDKRLSEHNKMNLLVQNMNLEEVKEHWETTPPWAYYGEIQQKYQFVTVQEWLYALKDRMDTLRCEQENEEER